MKVKKRFRSRHTRDASFSPLSAYHRIQLERLSATVRRLDARQAIPATSSNFSLRIDSEQCFISRSGIHKRDLNPSSFLRVSIESGKAVHSLAPRPSDELAVHQALYKLHPELRCILHCHAAEIEKVHAPGVRIEGHELLKALGFRDHQTDFYLNAFENTQDMSALARAVEKLSKGSPEHTSLHLGIFILEHHGIYCGGASVQNAEARLEAILHLLQQTR